MDIFQNEQTRVEKRIPEVVPQFEDIGTRGKIIGGKLHELKNALKYPASAGHNLSGSGLGAEDVSANFEKVKHELGAYSENSAILIKDLTKILTEVRYSLHSFTTYPRSKTVNLWAFGSTFSGRNLLYYLFSITAIIVSSWLLSVSAVICDGRKRLVAFLTSR
jgi:hypothetical protein